MKVEYLLFGVTKRPRLVKLHDIISGATSVVVFTKTKASVSS